MAHHKRRRPKSRRAGCLMCKWWKDNAHKGGWEAQTMQDRKAEEALDYELRLLQTDWQ